MAPKKGIDSTLQDLDDDQIKAIKDIDYTIRAMKNVEEEFKDFKLGDIYIQEEWPDWNPNNISVEKNHMGFPVKYKVVHISQQGIPYLRQLNPNGKPTGSLHLPKQSKVMWMAQSLYLNQGQIPKPTSRFIPDPDALDSILLQQDYEPMAAHKEKLTLFNDINKHNKKVTIKTGWNQFNNIANFFKGLQPGDKFWTSPEKGFVLQSLQKNGREWEIKCKDLNGAEHVFNFSHFHCRRLYSDQPRSFAKESAT